MLIIVQRRGGVPMDMPTGLDAAVMAPAAILGLLGLWLGFGRSSVAWPMRWLIPFLGACFGALPAVLYLVTNNAAEDLLGPSGILAATAAGATSFMLTMALLTMFMRNLRARVAVWTGGRRPVGSAERLFGGLFGIACGLLLVAIPFGLYQAARPDPREDPAWMRESASLAYLRSATDAARRAVSPLWASGDARR
jgi:hypothetical protein